MDNRRTPTPVYSPNSPRLYSPNSPRPYSPPPDTIDDCDSLRDEIRCLRRELNDLRKENDDLKQCKYDNKELLELVRYLQDEQLNNALHVARVKRARDEF